MICPKNQPESGQDPRYNYQFRGNTEEHVKPDSGDIISKIQTLGNSTGQMTKQQINHKGQQWGWGAY